MRALAQRSAEAAKEIKALISGSRRQVDKGVELVGLSGGALDSIVGQVTEISSAVADITSAAHEQMASLGEVSSAVNQIDQVTQRNAAMVEETTAASHELAHEASELAALVGWFKISAAQPAARRASAPARPAAAPRTTTAMKTVGRGGAAPAPAEDEWENF